MLGREKKDVEMVKYSKVQNESVHGKFFTIEDEDIETAQAATESVLESTLLQHQPGDIACQSLTPYSFWRTLTFAWMQDLLNAGNTKALTMDDLYPLPATDQADFIYKRFKTAWNEQLRESSSPSLAWSFAHSYGKPFLAAAVLKFVHDSCLFIGPLLLNLIINFLNDPNKPLSYGLWCVFGLFCANLVMSLCLRQYFWWCYRVGMNLRSAVVTAVYHKSLVVSTSVMNRKTTGEISNLMSVDSSRLQELTPYLHALWYSFFQITIALVFLYQELGISCLAGMTVIIIAIPVTSKVSSYMKTLQKQLSSIRDERIKLTNEVLSGMKVIKLQAWEREFQQRILAVRDAELKVFKQYTISQAFSGALYTTIPLLVAISTFVSYVSLGNSLTVGTALTSLALFDLLRFPLFMLPTVINNVVEARVSVDRVQAFLLEEEHKEVGGYPLREKGVLMYRASLVHDLSLYKRYAAKEEEKEKRETEDRGERDREVESVESGGRGAGSTWERVQEYVQERVRWLVSRRKEGKQEKTLLLTEEKKREMVQEALLLSSEEYIRRVEGELAALSSSSFSSPFAVLDPSLLPLLEAEGEDREKERETLLTLTRITLQGREGELVCVVGGVGSGKSSLLNSFLGNLLLCAGRVSVKGRVAYTSQLPFIANTTLKENILFGEEYDGERYEEALQLSSLLPDLAVLPAGDLTEIGERGINLSGGQKSRVGLARAVYCDAQVYLLDDPLSALDAHVGREVFFKCILALKKRGKCVIFVTNALQYAKYCDRVVVLKEGQVVEQGGWDELLEKERAREGVEGQGRGVLGEMVQAMQESRSSLGNGEAVAGEGEEIGDIVGEGEEESKEEIAPVSITKTRESRKPKSIEVVEADGTPPLPSPSPSPSTSGKLITTEERGVGNVGWDVYYTWCLAAGGLAIGGAIVFNYYLGEGVSVFTSFWLSLWASDTTSSTVFYLSIYILINVVVVAVALGKELYSRFRALSASSSLFCSLLSAVLYAPMSFYDTTPLGRVLNRFSKDIYTIDEQIPSTLRSYLTTMARVTSTLLYVCIVTPLFVLGLFPIAFFYYFAQKYYIKTSRELTRIESISRSPIYALFGETLEGLATIRAYAIQSKQVEKNNSLLDNNQRAYFLNFSANCWLAVRLEFAGTLIVSFAALFAVLGRNYYGIVQGNDQYAALAGLSISLALSVTQSLNWTVRMASDMESQMVSVERVNEYARMQQESPHYLPTDPASSSQNSNSSSMLSSVSSILHQKTWPTEGKVEFKEVCMRYRAGLPLVLSSLTLSILPREKVGIVGRTGAGKSSLLTALLRLVELESGVIEIDGVDISKLGLNLLRSSMAIIPQDPVLFSGTIRSNLDPFSKYSDNEVWDSLRRCLLGQRIGSLGDSVTENGGNFSVGQRQLLCIARALLAKAKIIIMDEATAAVDVETDSMIQKTIRSEFAHATVLTVAHRLNTIMDSDKVLVMDRGAVAEFAPPQELLGDEGSMFYALVKNWEQHN